jgi:hypothetical protein
VLDTRALEFDMVIEMVKTNKSPGTDQNSIELFIAETREICFEILKLFNSTWNKGELPERGVERVDHWTDLYEGVLIIS